MMEELEFAVIQILCCDNSKLAVLVSLCLQPKSIFIYFPEEHLTCTNNNNGVTRFMNRWTRYRDI